MRVGVGGVVVEVVMRRLQDRRDGRRGRRGPGRAVGRLVGDLDFGRDHAVGARGTGFALETKRLAAAGPGWAA